MIPARYTRPRLPGLRLPGLDAWAAWLTEPDVRAMPGAATVRSEYYLGSHVFWTKMALFLLVLALEIAPMVALIQWRGRVHRGEAIDFSRAPRFARISRIQAWILVAMVLAATAMARGIGA